MLTRLQNLIQKNHDSSPPPVRSFQVGQIFQGKVEKLFPNHMAFIQVGRQKLVAQLQIGLALGENYWFQVESLEGKPQLKVLQVNQENSGDEKTTIAQLLKEMKLSYSKSNIELVQFFLKEGIPLSKGILKEASDLFSHINLDRHTLQALKEMIQNNLPLTKEVMGGMSSIIGSESLQQLMTHLLSMIGEQPRTRTMEQLQALLKPMVQTEGEKVSENVIKQLLSLWLDPQKSSESKIAFTLLQRLGIFPSDDETTVFQQWLNNGNLIKLADLENKQNLLQALKDFLYNHFSQKGMNDAQLLTLLFGKSTFSSFVHEDKTVNIQGQLTSKEQQLLERVIDEAIQEFPQFEKGKDVLTLLKNLYDKIGYRYEKQLLNGKFAEGNIEELKSVLLQMIKEDVPQGVKEASQALLNRIIGLQLVSTETTNVLQHYVMQIPLSFWNKTTELTIQWQGKKRDDGKVDPNYCRVLFYLNMDVLLDTIVDMQVQNRVVRLSIYNDTDGIQSIGKIYEKELREKLQDLGYMLSTITFSNIEKREKAIKKMNEMTILPSESYSGVDIRI